MVDYVKAGGLGEMSASLPIGERPVLAVAVAEGNPPGTRQLPIRRSLWLTDAATAHRFGRFRLR
jgi:hypothetical protein